jgi:uncharacterized membrane protein
MRSSDDDDPVTEDNDDRFTRFERAAARDIGRAAAPAWRRHTDGEQRWPSALAILTMIALQAFLPERLSLGPRYALPVVEVAIILALGFANPGRMNSRSGWARKLALSLITLASLGNAWSVVALVLDIVSGRDTGSAAELLASGGNVWLINMLTFAVWYWEFDRGGPVERALGTDPDPDFLFPQMTTPDMAPKDWEPEFADYLYLAFTNSTAFSPTDVLPFSRWAKTAMLLQSAISLMTAALVVARAVNALN